MNRKAASAGHDSDLTTAETVEASSDFDLNQVRLAVRGIQFGEVRVIIQNGLVVQIERVEKQRLR